MQQLARADNQPDFTQEQLYEIFGEFKEVKEGGAKNFLDALAMSFVRFGWQMWQGISVDIPRAIMSFFKDPEIVSQVVLEGITPQKIIITDPKTGLMKWAYSYGGVIAPYEKVELPTLTPGMLTNLQTGGLVAPNVIRPSGAAISEMGLWAESILNDLSTRYEQNVENNQQFFFEHPEFQTPKEWIGKSILDKSSWTDPWFIASTIADSIAYSAAFIGTTLAVGAATGNPLVGMLAGWAITTPAQVEDLNADLIASGASEDAAAQLSLPFGALINSIEMWGDFPLLKALSPAFANAFRRSVQDELVNLSSVYIRRMAFKTFGQIEVQETMEEIIQQAIQNGLVSTFDKNRHWFDNLPEITVRTLIATLPFAVFGGGTQTARLYSYLNSEQKAQITDTINKLTQNGVTRDQAEVVAISNVLETPEGQKVLTKVVEDIGQLAEIQNQVHDIYQENVADKVLQDIKVAEGITNRPIPQIVTGQAYTATVFRGYKPGTAPTDEGLFGKGTYYTTSQEYAETYDGKEVMTVNLSNPFVINTQQEAEAFWNEHTRPVRQQALEEGKTVEEADELAAQAARAWLESQGYDGLIARNIIEKGDEIVVFEPQKTVGPKVPVAEAGMPEAGIQPSMLEEVPSKGSATRSTGETCSSSY